MKRNAAKFLSALLAFALSFSLPDVSAANIPQSGQTAPETDLEIEGTDSVGDLAAKALAEEEERKNGSSFISNLEINGSKAAVTYQAGTDGDLAVAVYGQDSKQMKAYGKISVPEGEGTAVVELEGELPQYFTATAFLLDSTSHAPLCDSYTSELYTRELQELMDMTTEDFGEDKVLNLDEDKDSNFVVYNEKTSVIAYQPGRNQVTKKGPGIYTIQNADSSFTSLKPGDSFSYTYENGTVLILKVKSVQTDGDTVTITEDKNVELEDVFDYVKIEGGYKQEPVGRARAAIDFEDDSHSTTKSFGWTKTLGSGSVSAALNASGSLTIAPYIKVYLALKSQHVEFTLTFSASFDCSINGKISRQSVDLLDKRLTVTPAPGVTVSFMPQLEFESNAQASFHAKMVSSVGFSCENGNGFSNKSSKPQLTECDFELEASVYLGLRMDPDIQVNFCGVDAGSASLDARIGAEITGRMKFSGVKGNISHLCKACIAGDIVGKAKVDGTVSLIFIGSKSSTILNSSNKLSDFYYSIDKKEFGWRTCPHLAYKITLSVTDDHDNPVKDAAILGTELETDPVTDKDGKAEFYLPSGGYTLRIDTKEMRGMIDLEVTDAPKNAEMKLEGLSIVASGTCANLEWKLDENGLLTINGIGDMKSWNSSREVPWSSHSRNINSVVLEAGVTSIGACAFDGYDNLTSITIPEGITFIDKYAFRNCENLAEINLPFGIESIGEYAFEKCNSLTKLELPQGMLYLDKGAFINCKGLKSVVIPDSMVKTAESAFQGCEQILTAEVGNGTIDAYTFQNCTSLTTLTLGSGVNGILGAYAFQNCANLTSITIPDKINRIHRNAFQYCTSLKNVKFGNNLTYIDNDTFYGCTRLNNIIIPDSVTEISDGAFLGCTNLTNLTLGNHLKNIGHGAFKDCIRLNSITIPASITEIEDIAFENCTSLSTIYFMGELPNFIARNWISEAVATVYYPNTENWKKWIDSYAYLYPLLTWSASSSYSTQSDAQEQPEPTEASIEPVSVPRTQAAAPLSLTAAPGLETSECKTLSPSSQIGNADTNTAEFTDLSAGKSYVLLAVRNAHAEDLLSFENLLYIAQNNADAKGTLSFTYVPRTDESAEITLYGPGETSLPIKDPEKPNPDTPDPEKPNPDVSKKDINSCTAVLSASSYIYNGAERRPDADVKDGSNLLKPGVDYTITYKDNINAGTAHAIIGGIGNYTGTASLDFTIQKADNIITASNFTKTASSKMQSFSLNAKNKGNAAMTYNSNQRKQVKISSDGKVTIAKNFVGKAELTISAAETQNYKKAVRKIILTVNPAKVRLMSAKSTKRRKLTLRWTKNKNADGYQIQYSTSAKFKKGAKTKNIKGVKKISKTIPKVKKGTYYVRVRAYKKVSKKTFYSGWSNIKKAAVKK